MVADLDNDDGLLDVLFTSGLNVSRGSVNSLAFIYWGSPGGFSPKARTGLESFTTILDATVADFNRERASGHRPDQLQVGYHWRFAGDDLLG